MFHDIFCSLSYVGLDYVITIQERHFTVRFDPNLAAKTNTFSFRCEREWKKGFERGAHLVLCVPSQQIQRGNV